MPTPITPEQELIEAAGNGAIASARLLVAKGVNVNTKDSGNWTPLHIVVLSTDGAAFARLLLDNGADVNARNASQATPLHLAAREGEFHPETIRLLLERGADVTARDCFQRTPLRIAQNRGHKPVIIMLEEAIANTNADSMKGFADRVCKPKINPGLLDY